MSKLDDLDEHEAGLELELKREYAAVFGLFQYCVITQDSTYLCNTYSLIERPQANGLFFHLTMKDVWVWDKNRPTRMIPRVVVYTSSNVTIEDLRNDDTGPRLAAQEIEKSCSDPLPFEDD